MTLLIDADYIAYKSCVTAETEIDFGDDVILVTSRFSEAYNLFINELGRIASDTGCFDDLILFFSDSSNFRKTIYPDYKGHRNRKKPCGYRRLINRLTDEYCVITMPQLEADDAIGIYATNNPGNIIVSPDKDMRQIPGDLYDMKDGIETITVQEGIEWHYIQTLAGDSTDGYSGCPSIGVKRAKTLLDKEGCTWDTVVKTFKANGLTEDDALLNARLAKILQVNDYDFEHGEPRLWVPTTSGS